MSDLKNLEIEALEELKAFLDGQPRLEPLQRYVQEKLFEAGEDSQERMAVMMELLRFNLYLESMPEFKELKTYVLEVEEELKERSSEIFLKKAA